MGRIFITGDIHGNLDIGKLASKKFPIQKELTKDDFVIICGDFGLLWDKSAEEKYWLEWLEDKPFTTLFIDGNHENFNLLEDYKVEDWNGGKIQKINSSVYHLMRGQLYNINGKKIFTLGGAESHDKEYRTENLSWWPQESITLEDLEEGIANIKKNKGKIDAVVTHCAPRKFLSKIDNTFETTISNTFLQTILFYLDFEKWYCGHYHMDKDFGEFNCLYDDIKEI